MWWDTDPNNPVFDTPERECRSCSNLVQGEQTHCDECKHNL